MSNLIGISGKLQSGKDTVAQMIQYLTSDHGLNGTRTFQECIGKISEDGYGYSDFTRYNSMFEIKRFAGKLKKIVSLLTGCDLSDLESDDFKNKNLPVEWKGGKVTTYRELLQKLGTELLRDGVHKDIHINSLFADWEENELYQHGWLVTDVRFENEFDAIISRRGITLRVERLLTFNEWSTKYHHQFKIIEYNSVEDSPKLISKLEYLDYLIKYNINDDDFFNKHLHASEISLDHHYLNNKFDHVIFNDGDLIDLERKVREFLIKFKIFN